MAERVVVALEPVEVEDHQEGWLDRLLEDALEVDEQLPAIAETGQRVGDRLLAGQLEEPAVLAERERRGGRPPRASVAAARADGEDVDPLKWS